MAASTELAPIFAAAEKRGEVLVKELPKFDLESYISNYEGHTRLVRLNHIARLCPPLAIEALHLAIPESLDAKNPDVHVALTSFLYELAPQDALARPDTAWVERRQRENKRETERLEAELKGYKNNLIKESIRMGQEDIATHYLAMADYENAQRSFQRMREYCTTPKHVAEMTIKLIYTSLSSYAWLVMQSNCHKAGVLTMKPEEKAKFDPAIEACSALAYLGVKDYAAAAKSFLRVSPSYITADPISSISFQKQVVTGNDIAVYGGLTALATMDRAQLRTQVLDSADFRTFLELEPHIRRAISAFCDAKYSACLQALEAYRADYMLDIYLSSHLGSLLTSIRAKSIVQYFVPFSHVRISDLAVAFPQPGQTTPPSLAVVTAMQAELVDMIHSGALDARIDAVNGLLLARDRHQAYETRKQTLDTAAEIEHGLRLKLHRLNMALAGLELSAPTGGGGGGGGGGAKFRGGGGGGVGSMLDDPPQLATPMSNV